MSAKGLNKLILLVFLSGIILSVYLAVLKDAIMWLVSLPDVNGIYAVSLIGLGNMLRMVYSLVYQALTGVAIFIVLEKRCYAN